MPDRTPSRAPSRAELKMINQRFSRSDLKASDLAVLDPVHMANGYQLAHGLYFIDPLDSLSAMADQINGVTDGAKPVHLHVNHATGGYFKSGTLGLGTFFSAEFTDNARGPVLSGKLYIVRGLVSGGFDSTSLIDGYDAGLWEDVSIGQDWGNAKFVCDVCGNDVLGEQCTHLGALIFGDPLVDGSFATMTVHQALLHETSAVWRGALSDAGVGKLSVLSDSLHDMGLERAPGRPTRDTMASTLYGARQAECFGMSCSAHGKLQESGLGNVLFEHTSAMDADEGDWSKLIRAQRKFLPDNAFADESQRMFPHHWVQNGVVGASGRFADNAGSMLLHGGGLSVSVAHATADEFQAVRSHLTSHLVDGSVANQSLHVGGFSQEAIEAMRLSVSSDPAIAFSKDHHALTSANGTEHCQEPNRADAAQEDRMKTVEQLKAELEALQEKQSEGALALKESEQNVVLAEKKLSVANDALVEVRAQLDAAEPMLEEGKTAQATLTSLQQQLAEAGIPEPTAQDLKRLAVDAQAALTHKDVALASVLAKIDDLSGDDGMDEDAAGHYRELAEHLATNSLSNSAAATKLEKLGANLEAEHRFLGVKPGRRSKEGDEGVSPKGNLSPERETRRKRFKISTPKA